MLNKKIWLSIFLIAQVAPAKAMKKSLLEPLPDDCLYEILSFLDGEENLKNRLISHSFRSVIEKYYLSVSVKIRNEKDVEKILKIISFRRKKLFHIRFEETGHFYFSLYKEKIEKCLAENGNVFNSLKICDPNNWYECPNFHGKKLPKNLKTLTVYRCPNFHGNDLPKNLEKLAAYECPNFHGKKLPESMKKLVVQYCQKFYYDNLPESLKLLHVWRLGDSNFYCSKLPRGLEELQVVHCCNLYANKLPKNLKTLVVENCQKFYYDNLPEGLKTLSVWYCTKFDGKNLPKKLKNLNVRNFKPLGNFDINNLPVSLLANLETLHIDRVKIIRPVVSWLYKQCSLM